MSTIINAGRVAPVPKGAYNNNTAYTRLDIVSYNGSSYICTQATTGNLPTNTTYWQMLAQGAGGGSLQPADMVVTMTYNNIPDTTHSDIYTFAMDSDQNNVKLLYDDADNNTITLHLVACPFNLYSGGTLLASDAILFGCIYKNKVYSVAIYNDGNDDVVLENILDLAPLNSPQFTGVPTAPTPSAVSNDTTIATTAFVQTAISGIPTADAPVVVTLTESGGVYSIDYDVQDLQTELSGMELPSSVLMFEDNPDIITLRLVNAQKEVDHNGVTEKTTIWSGESDGVCYVVSAYYDSVNLVDVVEMYVEDTILNKVSVSGSASVTQALSPSTFYSFETALTDLTITLTATTGQGLPIYGGRFATDAGGCSMTIPAGVTAASGNPSIGASKTYEFNILDNILILLEL